MNEPCRHIWPRNFKNGRCVECENERLRAALEVLKAELPDSSQIIQAVLDGMSLEPAEAHNAMRQKMGLSPL